MRTITTLLAASVAAGTLFGAASNAHATGKRDTTVHLGPRPFYLVDKMSEGALKRELQHCAATTKRYKKSAFSIGHRGAPLKFPEHTEESYLAAARMGAGVLECDVSFTGDGELVCRHSQCDLHTTTNILETELAAKCSEPFVPAQLDGNGGVTTPASARCCTSDITLEEYKNLEGKMDGADTSATAVEQYVQGTASWRTDLYSTGATLLSHKESIELFTKLGTQYTPELKAADPDDLEAAGLNQETYAAKLIQEYIDAGVHPNRVWAQSFNFDDVKYWIDNYPEFGKQAVFLDGRYFQDIPAEDFIERRNKGLNVIAPPMAMLVTDDGNGAIVPSEYAKRATDAGLHIISWTTERSGRINEDVVEDGSTFYYETTLDALANDGDILTTIDVLAQQVGIIGLFSDWPATTTFYANCKKVNANGR